MPLDFLRAQGSAYGQMAQEHSLRRLDGNLPPEVIADRLAYEVLGTYFASYRTFINTVFLKNPGQWQ